MDGKWTKKREQKFNEKAQKQKEDKLNKLDFKGQFSDVKETMKTMSREDWETLPDAIDGVKNSRKKRQNEYQRYTPVPDSIIQSASIEASGGQIVNSEQEQATAQAETEMDTYLDKLLEGQDEQEQARLKQLYL